MYIQISYHRISINILVYMARSWFPSITFYWKKPAVFGKMVDFSTGEEIISDNSGASYSPFPQKKDIKNTLE